MLFVKYSIAILPPGVSGKRRMIPALIMGNVIPSRMDCGTISRLAASHFSRTPISGEPMDGSIDV